MVCKYSLAYFYSEWNVLGKGEMFMMQENKQKIARANPLRTQESNWRSWPDRKGGRGSSCTRTHGNQGADTQGGWYLWWQVGEEVPV